MMIMMTNAAENIPPWQITLWYLKNHKPYESPHALMHFFVQAQERDQPLSFIKASFLRQSEFYFKAPSSAHAAGFLLTFQKRVNF